MNHKSSFSQQTIYIVALVVGTVGIAAANLVTTQSALGKTPPVQVAQSSALAGSWRLVMMGEPTSPAAVPQATELTAEFNEGRISGSGGCNRFMGGYQTQGDKLTVEPLASSLMACEDSAASQEARYLKALQAAQRYEVDSQGQLTIFYQIDQESGVLRFASQNVRGLW